MYVLKDRRDFMVDRWPHSGPLFESALERLKEEGKWLWPPSLVVAGVLLTPVEYITAALTANVEPQFLFVELGYGEEELEDIVFSRGCRSFFDIAETMLSEYRCPEEVEETVKAWLAYYDEQ